MAVSGRPPGNSLAEQECGWSQRCPEGRDRDVVVEERHKKELGEKNRIYCGNEFVWC